MPKAKCLLLLDKQFPTISRSEIPAIAEIKEVPVQIEQEDFLKLKVISTDEGIRFLSWRSAYVKEVYKILCSVRSLSSSYLKRTFRNAFLSHQGLPGTFRIDVNTDLVSTQVEKQQLIHRTANLITKQTNAVVSLESPEKIFSPLVRNSEIILLAKFPPLTKDFRKREPKYRPYSPSITMAAKLSRALVNLARASAGKPFLDPFCGSGSFLLEAAAIGAKTIGCDLSKKSLGGALWNAKFFDLASRIQLQKADATNLSVPANSIWSIATDLPYGKAAGLYGREIGRLYRDFLVEAKRILRPKRYLAFCASGPIETIVEHASGWTDCFHLKMPLPGDLTRHIFVLQKEGDPKR